ncbi:hypothetical protein [Bacillus sp. AFS017336]|uniref:hypothetical protein n=1 Tax=Bacillus sp. AFS017336 TaxID=2033489 RepID=UPI000BF1C390|nr:hypothetical protein [Bacillus sp. AFS017336]PEL13788.1 hypothetical protein CN601_03490 [Bacillus sp. AFS017336]
MTLAELHSLLEVTGLPVAYSHFTATKSNPVTVPPFICYLETDTDNFFADNKVYQKAINVLIELYTKKKDSTTELIIEQLLDDNEIPYLSSSRYIESENIFQKTYEVRLK